MTTEEQQVAERVVQACSRPLDRLDDQDVMVLTRMVQLAGWPDCWVVPGKLRGNYLDQDGSRTGETFPINSTSPFKVVVEEDGKESPLYAATHWLDAAVRLAYGRSSLAPSDDEERAAKLAAEIERSRPMTPIVLTAEGDELREYPRDRGGFVDHSRDHNKMGMCVGVHRYCDSFVDRRRTSANFDALVCRGCYLRVAFPSDLLTYGELRAWLAQRMEPRRPTGDGAP